MPSGQSLQPSRASHNMSKASHGKRPTAADTTLHTSEETPATDQSKTLSGLCALPGEDKVRIGQLIRLLAHERREKDAFRTQLDSQTSHVQKLELERESGRKQELVLVEKVSRSLSLLREYRRELHDMQGNTQRGQATSVGGLTSHHNNADQVLTASVSSMIPPSPKIAEPTRPAHLRSSSSMTAVVQPPEDKMPASPPFGNSALSAAKAMLTTSSTKPKQEFLSGPTAMSNTFSEDLHSNTMEGSNVVRRGQRRWAPSLGRVPVLASVEPVPAENMTDRTVRTTNPSIGTCDANSHRAPRGTSADAAFSTLVSTPAVTPGKSAAAAIAASSAAAPGRDCVAKCTASEVTLSLSPRAVPKRRPLSPPASPSEADTAFLTSSRQYGSGRLLDEPTHLQPPPTSQTTTARRTDGGVGEDKTKDNRGRSPPGFTTLGVLQEPQLSLMRRYLRIQQGKRKDDDKQGQIEKVLVVTPTPTPAPNCQPSQATASSTVAALVGEATSSVVTDVAKALSAIAESRRGVPGRASGKDNWSGTGRHQVNERGRSGPSVASQFERAFHDQIQRRHRSSSLEVSMAVPELPRGRGTHVDLVGRHESIEGATSLPRAPRRRASPVGFPDRTLGFESAMSSFEPPRRRSVQFGRQDHSLCFDEPASRQETYCRDGQTGPSWRNATPGGTMFSNQQHYGRGRQTGVREGNLTLQEPALSRLPPRCHPSVQACFRGRSDSIEAPMTSKERQLSRAAQTSPRGRKENRGSQTTTKELSGDLDERGQDMWNGSEGSGKVHTTTDSIHEGAGDLKSPGRCCCGIQTSPPGSISSLEIPSLKLDATIRSPEQNQRRFGELVKSAADSPGPPLLRSPSVSTNSCVSGAVAVGDVPGDVVCSNLILEGYYESSMFDVIDSLESALPLPSQPSSAVAADLRKMSSLMSYSPRSAEALVAGIQEFSHSF
eukprot:TRINITY_DN48955_c0_g1_i1.p1 TRINITY_DN48955_c0_g1~~TRINITY_DN48955_c0_g1_i1.p1  ORF type:complete len:945 (+),score=114.62 TRINITY_DN48955_c0_g1_i1:75-2909(+)